MPGFTSKVQIFNAALNHVKSKATVASETERSLEAQQCSFWYDHALTVVLEAYEWSFADQKASLTLLSDSTWTDSQLRYFGYAYALPADILKPLYIAPKQIPPIRYQVTLRPASTTQQMLLCDIEDAALVYTANVSLVNLFPAHFVEALGWYLGMLIAPKFGGDTYVKSCAKGYAETLPAAMAHDANYYVQEDREPKPDASWITARG